jgi:hypothetical protein
MYSLPGTRGVLRNCLKLACIYAAGHAIAVASEAIRCAAAFLDSGLRGLKNTAAGHSTIEIGPHDETVASTCAIDPMTPLRRAAHRDIRKP